nr:hypothetical protein [Nostoc sp. ChiQUE02]
MSALFGSCLNFCFGEMDYIAIALIAASNKDPSQNLDLCPI